MFFDKCKTKKKVIQRITTQFYGTVQEQKHRYFTSLNTLINDMLCDLVNSLKFVV